LLHPPPSVPLLKKTPLKYNQLKSVKYLIETVNIDLNIKENKGQTAFCNSVLYWSFDIKLSLVETAKVDTSIPTESGDTPLHRASIFSLHLEVVIFLVDIAKIDVKIIKNKEETARDIAIAAGNREIADYLETIGKDDVVVSEN
jgi:ankyrin repeat protein